MKVLNAFTAGDVGSLVNFVMRDGEREGEALTGSMENFVRRSGDRDTEGLRVPHLLALRGGDRDLTGEKDLAGIC